jgi:hypothetical protein
VGKIKNTEGSAMSVGLLVFRWLYRFYVFGHLSKWFVCVSSFMFLVVCLLLHCRLLGLLVTVGGLPKGGLGAFKLSGKTKIHLEMELS